MKYPLYRAFCCFALCISHAYATVNHDKLWLSATFTGPVTETKQFKYFIEPEFRVIDDKYKFEETLLWMGLGWQASPNWIFFIGETPYLRRNLEGTYEHGNILWQQAEWKFFTAPDYSLINRSRFEENKRSNEPIWHYILRENLLITYPFKNWPNHSLILFDEIFFNLNHPLWINSSSLINQNRAYLGISTYITKQTLLSVGYMNQYEFRDTNRLNNIILINVRVNTDN